MIKYIAKIDKWELQELLEAEFENISIDILDIEFDKQKKEIIIYFKNGGK